MSENLNLTDFFILHLMIYPFLYAETHYRFRYFFSFLKKKEPEIIADIPLRIHLGAMMPILIIIKDADKYPVRLNKLSVYEKNQILFSHEINKNIRMSYSDLVYYMSTNDLTGGKHQFNIQIEYAIEGRLKTCFADNHRGTSHEPFSINISTEPLPRFENCYLGETHSHSNYTSDQVEFGTSLSATQIMARALELDFFCTTDHSYDLDDHKDNYLKNDPNLGKWADFQQEVIKLNQKDKTVLIIPGEEVTVRNVDGKNVHLLIYNSETFYPGTGDSGEKWFQNRSELSISDVIEKLSDSSIAVAAHPSETTPFLQKLLINRDSWQSQDCAETGLHGMQFINGGEKAFLNNGKHLWIEQLLSDNRLTGIAGNDAHGNFSRFRQIGFPFFTMRENHHHLFGNWFTGVYIRYDKLSIKSFLDAIKSGSCYMTNGPALLIQMQNTNTHFMMGEECPSPSFLKIMVRSIETFGKVSSIYIILGDLTRKEESIYYHESPDINETEYQSNIPLTHLPQRGYIRVEVETDHNFQALSNPVWFHM
jgi:hypothetical protein